MVKYRKLKEKDIQNDPLCRWLAWFNKGSPAELVAEVVKMDGAIMTADERMAFVTGDKEAIDAYYRRMMALSDETSARNYAIETGLARGYKKGMKKGRAEGHAEEKLEIARNALAEGASIEFIQKITGLSPEVIEKL